MLPENYLDQRKYKIKDNKLVFHMGRKDKKYLKLTKDEYIESSFMFPTKDCIHPTTKTMDVPVTYGADSNLWLVDTKTLSETYPTTLTKFFGHPASENIDPEVEQWLQQVQIPIQHKIPKNSVLWLKYPTGDIQSDTDRIILVTEHIQDLITCYPWIKNDLPIYKCVHIETNICMNNINALVEWPFLAKLSNGTKIKKGGEGEICFNDVEIIIKNPSEHTLKYQLLMIKNFIQMKTIQKYKQHAQNTANVTVAKIGDRLFRWLAPKFEETDRNEEFFIPDNIKYKEFEFIASLAGIKEWKKTNITDTTTVSYEQSMKLFGKKNIVRKFRRLHGTTFILSHINIQFKYNKTRKMLRVDTFIKKE
eukprot:525219_1